MRSAIRDEVARVAADERDREEMRLIREQLAELAPTRSGQTSNSGLPVVPEGSARVRVQISAAIEEKHIDRALAAFDKVGKELGLL